MENVKFHGDFIRQRRKEKGLSQTQLGKAIGLNFRTISYLEAGKAGMKWTRIPALAKALNASVEEVCELPESIKLVVN